MPSSWCFDCYLYSPTLRINFVPAHDRADNMIHVEFSSSKSIPSTPASCNLAQDTTCYAIPGPLTPSFPTHIRLASPTGEQHQFMRGLGPSPPQKKTSMLGEDTPILISHVTSPPTTDVGLNPTISPSHIGHHGPANTSVSSPPTTTDHP